jgi:hypothetical protein
LHAIGIIDRERPFEPRLDFSVDASLVLNGGKLDLLAQSWRQPEMKTRVVWSRHAHLMAETVTC